MGLSYEGPVRLTDRRGEQALAHGVLEWTNDDGNWAGVLTAIPSAMADADDLIIELPCNRWWDVPFVSRAEIDLVAGTEIRVHGTMREPGVLQRSAGRASRAS